MNRVFRDARGESREETCFVDVEAWGRTGEIVAQYCRKGSPLLVEGRLRYDQWDDRETGKKRSRLTVTAEAVQLIGGSRDGAPQGQGYAEDMAGGQAPYYPQQPQQGGYYQQPATPPLHMAEGRCRVVTTSSLVRNMRRRSNKPTRSPLRSSKAPPQQPPAMPAFQAPGEGEGEGDGDVADDMPF
jgi:single-strand DNA-binding protein